MAARLAGRRIDAPCAGRGVCGGCGVRVLEGSLAPPDEAEMAGLRVAPSGIRLACRATIDGPVVVRPIVARTARAVPRPSGTKFAAGRPAEGKPTVAGVDLGTSTLAATVVESESRIEIGRGGVSNRQSMWGADVLSRVSAAQSGDAEALRQAAEESVLDVLASACFEEGLCLRSIERLVIAGNSAMAGLLLGLDVSGLGAHPFTAPYAGVRSLPEGSSVTKALAQGAQAVVLPPLAGFVGGDVLAGLVAEGFGAGRGGLYLDLGTNAEVVRSTGSGGLVVASAAAGPAFEAGGISSGGPAAEGAIQRVSYDAARGLELDVIGGVEPGWLCGSGLVSAIALLRRLGHLADDGLLSSSGPLEELFFDDHGVRSLRLAGSEMGSATRERRGSSPTAPRQSTERMRVTLTQLDVRAFQLAKAAVRSAIESVSRDAAAGARWRGDRRRWLRLGTRHERPRGARGTAARARHARPRGWERGPSGCDDDRGGS